MAVTIRGSGQIVQQVVFASTSTQTSTTSTTYVACTGMSATITPSNSSNKILILVSGSLYNSNISLVSFATIYRNGSNILNTGGFTTFYGNTGNPFYVPCGATYLDSPATTSATTYQVYIRSPNSGTAAWIDGTALGTGTITLMEIAYA
jgi:hypothetical protein